MGKSTFNKGQSICGYTVENISRLENMDASLIQLTHNKTGANHIHIASEDKENSFAVILRTVPEDSSGVAHILEHIALCGSEKFNVRDPFFSMLKRSLSTFMNALTSADWTMYPFSTQNKKDYFNLMDVYLDAVFFPKLDELSFKQEGHCLDVLENSGKNRELIYKGVVYNEMKGAMSSPSQVLGRSLPAALYPDTTYKHNSGGEPAEIPLLKYEELKQFHANYYHPSNSWFYTYGNLPLEESLDFINTKVLKRFSSIQLDSQVPAQPRWSSAKELTQAYAYDNPEDLNKKYQACVAWLICDARDSFEILVMVLLEQILLGNSASPLTKALIDSSLGTALSDATGFTPDNRDTMFACGLKDISESSVKEVEKIIFSTLKELVEKGINKELIESAIHQIEFSRKEITNSPYPFGLKLLLGIVGTLIHEGDPVSFINIDDDLKKLKKLIEKGSFFEDKIKHYFLDNPHRVLFTLKPDPTLEEETQKDVKKELSTLLNQMNDEDIEQIKKDSKALQVLQEAKEDLSALPTLELADVPHEIEIIKSDQIDEISFSTVYDKTTSGILYFTCPVGAGNISSDIYPFVPFFSKAFTNCGTKKHSYDRIAKLMDLYTGGISIIPFSGTYFSKEAEAHSFLAIQGKALDRNIEKMFELIREFMEDYSFTDFERLKNLLFQYQASLEASIVSAGHRYAISLSSRHLSGAAYINELWHGMQQYQMIKEITQPLVSGVNPEQALESLSKKLNNIARSILIKNNIKPAVIGSRQSLIMADKKIMDIDKSLPNHTESSFFTPDIAFSKDTPYEGWFTNTSVSFVGQSFKTVRITHEHSAGLAVISKILRSLYLHREIREKGGAYGGFAMYNTEEGIFSFGSYRDPNITRTLEVYKSACDYIINGDYTETDVKEAILQVCSEIDKPETPGPAAMKAFYRDITKLSDDIRRKFKDSLLALTKKKIQDIAQLYFKIDDSLKGTAVISNKASLEAANKELNNNSLKLFKI